MGRQQSRRVLLAGVAGQPLRAGSVLLYDDAVVRAVARWPLADHDHLLRVSPAGVFVLRLPRDSRPWPDS